MNYKLRINEKIIKNKEEDINYWLKYHSDCILISLFESGQNELFFILLLFITSY